METKTVVMQAANSGCLLIIILSVMWVDAMSIVRSVGEPLSLASAHVVALAVAAAPVQLNESCTIRHGALQPTPGLDKSLI